MQQAANELGITEPSQIIGAQDEQSKQLLALAQREGKDFSVMANKNGGWQALHKEYTFNTSALATTGDTTAGSAVITNIPSTSGLAANTWVAAANGIDTYAYILSVDSATQVTLTQAVSETQTGVSIQFGKVAYSLPSDLEYFVQRTFWDNAYKWELIGPITAQEKQILRYGVIASGPRRKFYIRNNLMYIDPYPGESNQLLAYDYFSNAWCESSGGTAQKLWTADTDVYKLDEDCFIQGIKWRFLRSKGLDYTQEKTDYDADCQRVVSRDGGNRELPIAGGTYGARFLSEDNIPETGYGS